MTAAGRKRSARAASIPSDHEDTRRRYYDGGIKASVVQVMQSDFYVTSDPNEVLATVLGSCVAVCVRDPVIRCGGMNHFLLPSAEESVGDLPSVALRYGSFSIERLINDILSRGGERDRLEVKVFGGGHVISGLNKIGHKNADFVEDYLKREGLLIAASHLRGEWPRKVRYTPTTGKVQMRELKDRSAVAVDREAAAQAKPIVEPAAGTIELF